MDRMPVSRGADPGGKLTLFDVIALAAAGGGAAIAFRFGYDEWGWIGGIPCGLAGLVAGHRFGQWPSRWMSRSLMKTLRRTDTAALWRRLHREYFLSHVIVPILRQERSVPAAELQDFTLGLLLSEDHDRRWHGWRTLSIWFPESAAPLAGINAARLSPEDRERIQQLRSPASPPP